MCRPREVDVQYRRNLESYQQWEDQVREDHEQAIRNLKKREQLPFFHVPDWVITLCALALLGAAVWTFMQTVNK